MLWRTLITTSREEDPREEEYSIDINNLHSLDFNDLFKKDCSEILSEYSEAISDIILEYCYNVLSLFNQDWLVNVDDLELKKEDNIIYLKNNDTKTKKINLVEDKVYTRKEELKISIDKKNSEIKKLNNILENNEIIYNNLKPFKERLELEVDDKDFKSFELGIIYKKQEKVFSLKTKLMNLNVDLQNLQSEYSWLCREEVISKAKDILGDK